MMAAGRRRARESRRAAARPAPAPQKLMATRTSTAPGDRRDAARCGRGPAGTGRVRTSEGIACPPGPASASTGPAPGVAGTRASIGRSAPTAWPRAAPVARSSSRPSPGHADRTGIGVVSASLAWSMARRTAERASPARGAAGGGAAVATATVSDVDGRANCREGAAGETATARIPTGPAAPRPAPRAHPASAMGPSGRGPGPSRRCPAGPSGPRWSDRARSLEGGGPRPAARARAGATGSPRADSGSPTPGPAGSPPRPGPAAPAAGPATPGRGSAAPRSRPSGTTPRGLVHARRRPRRPHRSRCIAGRGRSGAWPRRRGWSRGPARGSGARRDATVPWGPPNRPAMPSEGTGGRRPGPPAPPRSWAQENDRVRARTDQYVRI